MAEGRLNGKVAIVTGGATGIGGGIADKLAAEGASVLIVDIDEAGANARAVTIQDEGGGASAMIGDVSQEGIAKSMVDRAVAEFGRLDILVQNAY
ncbi:SDR family NAD(P)-dependent oxidoreductase, partial [bacterium]|nr:SDR family NAD(P)-dependent oxidoreductase [bacterium]